MLPRESLALDTVNHPILSGTASRGGHFLSSANETVIFVWALMVFNDFVLNISVSYLLFI